MSKPKESVFSTVLVATVLCIVCSIVVATAAVKLRPMQVANKQVDFQRNILQAAGIYEPAVSVARQFDEKVETRLIDFESGQITDAVDESYDQRSAAKDPSLSEALAKTEDVAGISRREKYARVYVVNDEQGKLDRLVLPIRGYGLWSTLYGFIALEEDLNTVVGLGYYEHAETPGLGGEVDNPRWKGQWVGKKIYDAAGEVSLRVAKGDPSADTKDYHIDAISGATLTSNGVHNMIIYWMGPDGYKPFLDNLGAKQGLALQSAR